MSDEGSLVSIRERLTRDAMRTLPPLCLDGAWGTELLKQGGGGADAVERWNIEHPDRVLAVARSYVSAGARIILTNTFSANRHSLARHGLESQAAIFSRAGAAISREAAGDRAWVFGSIGPTGKMVMMGELSEEEVADAAEEQAAALVEGGVDGIVIETQSDAVEAASALRGCRRVCDLPVGVTFTFSRGAKTMMGVGIQQAYEATLAGGADFVGANCGNGMAEYIPVAEEFKRIGGVGGLPIWIKGNAGKPVVDDEGETCYRTSPEDFASAAKPLVEAGVTFIGGCCGTTPDHIRALSARLEALTNGS